MRPGPIYRMRVDRDEDGNKFNHNPYLKIPYELMSDFDGIDSVNWRDDGAGVFTIILIKDDLPL